MIRRSTAPAITLANVVRAGVSVFERYNIVSQCDLVEAAKKAPLSRAGHGHHGTNGIADARSERRASRNGSLTLKNARQPSRP